MTKEKSQYKTKDTYSWTMQRGDGSGVADSHAKLMDDIFWQETVVLWHWKFVESKNERENQPIYKGIGMEDKETLRSEWSTTKIVPRALYINEPKLARQSRCNSLELS